jgi:hypothetical protein
MSSLPNWREKPIYSLRIINGEGLQASSAFSMELFGIMVAAAILAHCPDSTTIFSDCEAATKSIHSQLQSRKRIRASTRDASMLVLAAKLIQEMGTQVQWTKGHPERVDKDADNWTQEMWGNHLSDRSAAGSFSGDMDYQYDNLFSNLLNVTSFPDLDARDISPKIVPTQSWYFGSTTGQLVSTSISEAVGAQRLSRYIQVRDQDRLKRGLSPKWYNYNIPLAALLWQIKSQPHTRTLRNRLLYDKNWHGGNQAKALKPSNHNAKCPFCQEPDSADHWIIYCQNSPRAVTIRKEMFSSIRSATGVAAKETPDFAAILSVLSDDYLEYLTGPGIIPAIRRGLWSESQLDTIGAVFGDRFLSDMKCNALRKLFLSIGRITTDAVIKLWQARQLTELELVEYMKLNPCPSYTPPAHTYYPNAALPEIPAETFQGFLQVVTAPTPEPIVRISLTKTNRKLRPILASDNNPLVIPGVSSSSPLDIVPGGSISLSPQDDVHTEEVNLPMAGPADQVGDNNFMGLQPAPRVQRRKRSSGGMSVPHRLHFREARKNTPHWRSKRNALPPDPNTPLISKYLRNDLVDYPPHEGTDREKLRQDSDMVEIADPPVFIFDPG